MVGVSACLTDTGRVDNPSSSSKSVLSMHFIEDRMETLLAVASVPTLDHVKLYLVDWGYNTSEEKQKALQHSRIQLISKYQLH